VACAAMFRIDQLGLVRSALGDVGAAEMIGQVVATVRHCLPPRSDLGRTDEGFVAMFDAADEVEVDRVISAIGDAIRQPVTTRGRTMRVTASIGFTSVDTARADTPPPADLAARAETALRDAASRGGNRVVAFGAHTGAAAEATVRLWNELRTAIQYRQMEVWFQPIVNLTTRHPVAAEALSRWHHPQLGDVSPDEFIPSAERNSEILNIGAFVHDRATQVSRALRTDTTTRLPNFTLCINVAAEELAWPHFAASLLNRITSNDARPDWFSLEIAERSLDLDDRVVRDNMTALASAGLVLTLDGFGRSMAVLPQLIDLGIRRAKVDRSMVAQLMTDRRVERVIASMVQLAVALGLDTIATGVETEEQALLLAHLGCRSGQGFLFSPAVPETDLARVLRDLSTR
ncbi:MAG: EAL domain-containing protein, partial [Ilumatobacteraceae bacterium]